MNPQVSSSSNYFSVSLLGYHENVTEYGLHWNFFFTLASVTLLSSLILKIIKDTKAVWVSSVVVSILYEGLLTFGLAPWILATETPREDLISANREGIFSSLGYLAVYLAGKRELQTALLILILSLYQECPGVGRSSDTTVRCLSSG